jgi:predicted nucleotidyltransferase
MRAPVLNVATWCPISYLGFTVIALVEEKKREIGRLCRQFDVEKLDLFGSAATGAFRPSRSDLDFVVRFASASGNYLDRYLDLAEALEKLFQRPVDLITERSVRNPYFRSGVEATRQPVYERRNEEALA